MDDYRWMVRVAVVGLGLLRTGTGRNDTRLADLEWVVVGLSDGPSCPVGHCGQDLAFG